MPLYNKSTPYKYVDFNVQYSIQNRPTGEVLVISHKGVTTRHVVRSTKLVYDAHGGLDIDASMKQEIPKYINKIFNYKSPSSSSSTIKKHNQECDILRKHDWSFQVSMDANLKKIVAYAAWAESTKERYDAIISKALPVFGDTDWKKLTPDYCKKKISSWDTADKLKFQNLMRYFFLVEYSYGYKMEKNPWEGSFFSDKKAKKTKPSLAIKKSITPCTLSDGQIATIVERCFDLLKEKTKKQLFAFAILLILALGVSAEEVCALLESDFIKSPLGGHVLHIQRKRHKKSKSSKYCSQDYPENSFTNRKIHIGSMVQSALKLHLEKLKSLKGTRGDYLFPNLSKLTLPMRPHDLIDAIESLCTSWLEPNHHFSKSIYNTLLATSKKRLVDFGFEEEEIRHCLGLPPKTVGTKHYCGFSHPEHYERTGFMHDSWLSTPTMNAPLSTVHWIPKNAQDYITTDYARNKTTLSFVTVSFPPTEKVTKDFKFWLMNTCGNDIVATWTPKEDSNA